MAGTASEFLSRRRAKPAILGLFFCGPFTADPVAIPGALRAAHHYHATCAKITHHRAMARQCHGTYESASGKVSLTVNRAERTEGT
jgi:hypothetical protein